MEQTGYQEKKLSFSYLGVPVIANRLSAKNYRVLVEKITKNISIWVTKLHHMQEEWH